MAKAANGWSRLRTPAIALTLLLPLLTSAATINNSPHPSTMTATLSSIHDDDFVLVHMTGMCQSKQQYINAIADGTLNYFSARHDALEATVRGDSTTLLARSYVSAAVFGGGRHSWRLQMRFQLTSPTAMASGCSPTAKPQPTNLFQHKTNN